MIVDMKRFIMHILAIFAMLCVKSAEMEQCFTDDESLSTIDSTITALLNGSTNFSLDLFKNAVQTFSDPTSSGNVFISTISVWSILVATYLGAKEHTKEELETVLRIEDYRQNNMAELYPKLQNDLIHNSTEMVNYIFSLVNKLYFEESIQLKTCLAQLMNKEIQKLDFSSAPEESREIINKYVADQTNQKIMDLLPPLSIDSSTTLVMVNAAYFKGVWARTFLNIATANEDFFIDQNHSKEAKMMQQVSTYPYGQDLALDCSAIELPYSGNEISMLILLPNSTNVKDLVQKLNAGSLENLLGNMTQQSIQLSLPKFKIEQAMELKDTIRAMGINSLFEAGKADLSGFSDSRDLYVSSIRHKAYIEVNEGGTEVAAATAVVVDSYAALPLIPPIEFNVNRPFVFLLRNTKLNTILFVALIMDPTTM